MNKLNKEIEVKSFVIGHSETDRGFIEWTPPELGTYDYDRLAEGLLEAVAELKLKGGE